MEQLGEASIASGCSPDVERCQAAHCVTRLQSRQNRLSLADECFPLQLAPRDNRAQTIQPNDIECGYPASRGFKATPMEADHVDGTQTHLIGLRIEISLEKFSFQNNHGERDDTDSWYSICHSIFVKSFRVG